MNIRFRKLGAVAFLKRYSLIIATVFFASASQAQPILSGEDGYRLWLKYDLISDAELRSNYVKAIGSWRVDGNSITSDRIRSELDYALPSLLGEKVREQHLNNLTANKGDSTHVPTLIIGTPSSSKTIATAIRSAKLTRQLKAVGDEGYLIKTVQLKNGRQLLVAANTDVGALYGSFHLLRLVQTHSAIVDLDIQQKPALDIRILNHWDNPDRHVERGYAGQSIWDWHKLPDYQYQRYYDYARANASIGINGTVLNNVNANPIMLTPEYLAKVASLADIFRPYGIKVYLSIKFSSPQLLGGLETSDPLNKNVQKWWDEKVKEIYTTIPDFGGFLVKANSEGQPGPGDFGRTHAEGANMLADALAPYKGVVMWRAFVYANEKNEERSKQAYSEFKPLDGKFRDNVLVQVKNGPIDFQPREPFSPLFGATPKTPLMMEFQITQEYLGFSTHLAYLGPLYEEVLRSDTYAKGEGSSVAKVIDGSLFNNSISGMAGVANIGSDRNWTGHIILQANWYVFGRLSWDHSLSSQQIAEEWVRMTLSTDSLVVEKVTAMMMASREQVVNYMTPLGLHHLMDTGHHYGPGPWVDNLGRADWTPVYYHRADANGIGFDRSPTGVDAVSQYHAPLKERFSKPETTPENLLLWFHHLAWDYTMQSGHSLWDELVRHYYKGAEDVAAMQEQWLNLEGKIDPLQFNQVKMALEIQVKEANWWRDASVLYFQTFSKRPIPTGLTPPSGTLDEFKTRKFPYAPGSG